MQDQSGVNTGKLRYRGHFRWFISRLSRWMPKIRGASRRILGLSFGRRTKHLRHVNLLERKRKERDRKLDNIVSAVVRVANVMTPRSTSCACVLCSILNQAFSYLLIQSKEILLNHTFYFISIRSTKITRGKTFSRQTSSRSLLVVWRVKVQMLGKHLNMKKDHSLQSIKKCSNTFLKSCLWFSP